MSSEKNLVWSSDARRDYGLSVKDLRNLKSTVVQHCTSRYSFYTRMYDKEDLKQAAEAKRDRLEFEREHADELREERAAAAKAQRMAASCAATQLVSAFGSNTEIAATTDTPLSVEIWSMILCKLVDPVQSENHCDIWHVTHDLLNIALTCRAFHKATEVALDSLARKVPALKGDEDTDWNALIANPAAFKRPALAQAAQQLGLPRTGSKAELIMGLLGAFGLYRPTRAPARLILTLTRHRQGGSGGARWHKRKQRQEWVSRCEQAAAANALGRRQAEVSVAVPLVGAFEGYKKCSPGAICTRLGRVLKRKTWRDYDTSFGVAE